MAEDELAQRREMLGDLVTEARRRKFESVQRAIAATGLNRATWLRLEDGEKVRDDRLTAAERGLGWPPGVAFRVLSGEVLSVGMDADGNITSEMLDDGGTRPEPVSFLDLDDRLASHDRQIRELQQKVEDLQRAITPRRSRTAGEVYDQDYVPFIPDGLAADDPGEPTVAQQQDARDRDDNEGR